MENEEQPVKKTVRKATRGPPTPPTPPPPKNWKQTILDRNTTDLMVLTFTIVVALSILATGAAISIIKIVDPRADVSESVRALESVITTILGALMGLIAGRNEGQRPKE